MGFQPDYHTEAVIYAKHILANVKDANLKRLRRLEGQIRGLQKMVDEDRYCPDIITQIASVQEALRGVGRQLLRNHLKHCATTAIRKGAAEADRTYGTGDRALLLALDEGDVALVDTTFEIIAEECLNAGGHRDDEGHVEHWLAHRNEVSALEALTSKGYTVDTMEVTGSWADLPTIYRATLDALLGVEGTIAASAHQSHSYLTGGCLYFTFAGQVDSDGRDAYYRRVWDTGQRAALAYGGALSHHHGVGLNRGRFMAEALGPAHQVLVATKAALDPRGILNPGKLGLPSPWAAPEGW